jgi:hypothetical protein
MHRFIDGDDRMQLTLLPNSLEDYVSEENPVRVIEVFIEELDLAALGFSGMTPAATGRPGYHPSTLLKIYLYGYLNRLQSSRRLDRLAQTATRQPINGISTITARNTAPRPRRNDTFFHGLGHEHVFRASTTDGSIAPLAVIRSPRSDCLARHVPRLIRAEIAR